MGAAQSTRKITLVDDEKAGVIKLSESLAQRLRGQIEGQHAAMSERTSPAAAPQPIPPAPVPPPPQAIEKHPFVPEPPTIPAVVPVIPEPPAPRSVPRAVTPEPEPQTQDGPSSNGAEVPKSKPPALVLPVPHQVEEPTSAESPVSPDVGVAIRAGPGPTLSQPAGSIPPWSIYAEEAHLMVMRLRDEKEQEIKKLNQEWRDKMDAREKEFTNMARLSEEQVTTALKEVESLFMKASCTPVCQNQQEAVMNCYQDHPRQSLRCTREVEHFTQCVDLSRLQSIMKQEVH